VALAAVEDGAVIGCQDVIEHRSVGPADGFAGAALDGAELQPAFSDDRPERARANPGEADSSRDNQDERQP